MTGEIKETYRPKEAIHAQADDSRSHEGNPQNATTSAIHVAAHAAVIVVLSDAPQENPTTIPEKVSGVETLAAAGLPTPKHRLFLDASYFQPGKEADLQKKLKDYGDVKQIIVRSAPNGKPILGRSFS